MTRNKTVEQAIALAGTNLVNAQEDVDAIIASYANGHVDLDITIANLRNALPELKTATGVLPTLEELNANINAIA